MSDNTKEIRGLLDEADALCTCPARGIIIEIISLLPPVCSECGGNEEIYKPGEPPVTWNGKWVPCPTCSDKIEKFVKELRNWYGKNLTNSEKMAQYQRTLLRAWESAMKELNQALTHLTALNEQVAGLEGICQLAFDIHSRDPVNVKHKWGVCGAKAEELLCEKMEQALKERRGQE